MWIALVSILPSELFAGKTKGVKFRTLSNTENNLSVKPNNQKLSPTVCFQSENLSKPWRYPSSQRWKQYKNSCYPGFKPHILYGFIAGHKYCLPVGAHSISVSCSDVCSHRLHRYLRPKQITQLSERIPLSKRLLSSWVFFIIYIYLFVFCIRFGDDVFWIY